MKMNPVYKRESMVAARSFRLALMILVFNGVLALVALLNMYSTLAQVRLTAEIQYGSFMDLYLFVSVLEFVMLIFIMPAISAGSISGERERQTLDLMLTTQMTPTDIVVGKLMSSLSTMFLLIVSSFPIIAMVFVYGGVTMKDLIVLMLCFMVAGLFVGSLGLCCSALFKKSTLSTVVTYAIMGFIVFGTFGINWFMQYVNEAGAHKYMSAVSQTSSVLMTSGSWQYLMLLNPAGTFVASMVNLTNRSQPVVRNAASGLNVIQNHWVMVSIGVQLMLAFVMIWGAIRAIEIRKK
ncbi:MAG: ABC transporter permease [Brotaphodocola sp.]